jgi:hypothetical protein
MRANTNIDAERALTPGAPAATRKKHRSARQNGQILVIFAGAIITLIGIVAVVVDVSWYWANSLRVQRTADAAALAGAIYLPGSTVNAYSYAKIEATKNGYTTGGGVTVTPIQDSLNGGTDPRQLDVTVSAPVQTFFMRVFGLNTIQATRTAKAIYVQPVPMGSPQAYYGVGCFDLSATHATCSTAGNSNGASGVPQSTAGSVFTNGTQLNSQGFWGSVQTRGGNQSNGDAFSPANNTTSCGSSCGANLEYDPNGYSYSVDFSGSGGSIYIFDPAFCAMGNNAANIPQGTGDHWLSGTNPVSTYYTVWNTQGTAFSTADDTVVASSGTLFENQQGSDVTNGGPAVGGGVTDCSASAYHDKWWLVGQGSGSTASSLAAGTYRVQVTTTKATDATINASTNAENMFSIMATGGGTADVHGGGRMAAYNNLALGTQKFYLAQIDQTAAGKTLEIDLFDPGDVNGGAWLRVLNPDGNVYTPASFTWTADSNATTTSGSGTCIQTNGGSTSGLTPPSGCPNATSGGSFFQNSWIKVLIPLPTTYGSAGLTPAGESQAGWWKIEYTVGGGSDLTTWEVNVLGNPVHLVVP